LKVQREWLLVNKVFERVSINGSSGLHWHAISVLIERRNRHISGISGIKDLGGHLNKRFGSVGYSWNDSEGKGRSKGSSDIVDTGSSSLNVIVDVIV